MRDRPHLRTREKTRRRVSEKVGPKLGASLGCGSSPESLATDLRFRNRPAPALKNEKADRPDQGAKNSELSVHKGSLFGFNGNGFEFDCRTFVSIRPFY
jgi:hypothetical protein